MKTKERRNNNSVNKALFTVTSTDNWIGDEGVKSLSESLKSNTTLIVLDLNRKDKIKKTYKRHPSTTLFVYLFTNREQNWKQRSNIIE